MKVAVIGSGPASAGACLGLMEAGVKNISVFDIGRKVGSLDVAMRVHPNGWNSSVYEQVHAAVKKKNSGWIPEKSYFAGFPEKYQEVPIYKSDMFGGLSKFWGASFLPFTPKDLEDWPISYTEMSSYYKKIMKEVRITGTRDRLGHYFSDEFTNDRPVKVPEVFSKLHDSISASGPSLISGSPRLAVATSGDRACTYCGHCFYGCYKESIYSADQTIQRLRLSGHVTYVPGMKLLKFSELRNGQVRLEFEGPGNSTSTSTHCFDKVYIACGCIETTRIICSSLGLSGQDFPVVENPMYFVPLIYSGKSDDDMHSITALLNGLIGCMPDRKIKQYVHAQVYPINAYLWNHALAKALGRYGHHFAGFAQRHFGKHLFMMLVYLHGQYTEGSRMCFRGTGREIWFANKPEAIGQVRQFLSKLSDCLRSSEFVVVKKMLGTIHPGGSHHFAASVPMNRNSLGLGRSCSIANHVFIADSTTFPSLPAQNHSFTIMANAYRVAFDSV